MEDFEFPDVHPFITPFHKYKKDSVGLDHSQHGFPYFWTVVLLKVVIEKVRLCRQRICTYVHVECTYIALFVSIIIVMTYMELTRQTVCRKIAVDYDRDLRYARTREKSFRE